jgi:AcrR family transcriptional regulator
MTRAQLGRPVGASGEETRQRIIVATMRCVARTGYSRATIREIARTAEVTSASLYNYFPNKSELIKAAIAARTDVALPRLREAAGGPGDVIDRIEAVLDESGRLMREYPDLAAFEWAIRAEGAVDAGEAGDGFQAFRQIIEGIAEGAGEPGSVEAVYSLIYGLTELAATLPPVEYHAALDSAKRLIRGTLLR